jgi:hypothetical protein
MRQASRERDNFRRACGALAVGLPLLAANAGPAKAADHAYDRENQYGAVSVHGSDQARLPIFDRSKQLNAITVNDTDRSSYLPDGIRAGAYMIFPEIGTSVIKDDNIFGSEKGQGDVRREASAKIKLLSHMPRHVLDFMFSGRVVSFQDHDERNYADGKAQMQARIDVNHGHAFVGNFMTALDHEERRDGETPRNAKRPVEVLHNTADVGFVRSVGRLSVLAGATAGHKEFHAVDTFDGSRLPQSYRDTNLYSSYLHLRYQVSPGYNLIARATGLMEENRGNPSFNRSNRGYETTAGVEFEPSRLLRASLEAGVSQRTYDQQALGEIQTAIFNSRLTWMITPSLTLYFTGGREVNATSAAGASSRVDLRFKGALEYELQRNIVLTAGVENVGTDFTGTSRHDNLWVLTAGAQYFFNKNIYLSLDLQRDQLVSSATGTGFEGNKIMASVKFRQ